MQEPKERERETHARAGGGGRKDRKLSVFPPLSAACSPFFKIKPSIVTFEVVVDKSAKMPTFAPALPPPSKVHLVAKTVAEDVDPMSLHLIVMPFATDTTPDVEETAYGTTELWRVRTSPEEAEAIAERAEDVSTVLKAEFATERRHARWKMRNHRGRGRRRGRVVFIGGRRWVRICGSWSVRCRYLYGKFSYTPVVGVLRRTVVFLYAANSIHPQYLECDGICCVAIPSWLLTNTLYYQPCTNLLLSFRNEHSNGS